MFQLKIRLLSQIGSDFFILKLSSQIDEGRGCHFKTSYQFNISLDIFTILPFIIHFLDGQFFQFSLEIFHVEHSKFICCSRASDCASVNRSATWNFWIHLLLIQSFPLTGRRFLNFLLILDKRRGFVINWF